MNATRNSRRTIEGVVTSDKMAKTITVVVVRTYKHPKYGKYMRVRKKYHAHDEKGEAKTGDRVELAACRPLSKLKRWRLVRVIEHGVLTAELQADEALAGALGRKPATPAAADSKERKAGGA